MITIYSETPRVFEWEGIKVGLRMPKVGEMKEITRARDAFFNSITETTPQGDQTLMVDFQFQVGSMLACDPENAANAWFAKSVEEQKQLADNQIHKQLASDYPQAFFVAATAFFNREVVKAEQTDDMRSAATEENGEGEGNGENPPQEAPEQSGTPPTPTVPNSDASLSESPSISQSTPQPSISGDTTAS